MTHLAALSGPNPPAVLAAHSTGCSSANFVPDRANLALPVSACCRVSIVAEHFVRLLQHCGMPASDVDFIHGDGKVVGQILKDAPARSTLFTGSQAVAEQLVIDLKGKVSDAGSARELHSINLSAVCVT